MTERIERLREYILSRKHHVFRRTPAELGLDRLPAGFEAADVHPVERSARMLEALLGQEVPVILPGETLAFTRTITEIPDVFTAGEWAGIKKAHYLHERGTVSNLSPDYATTIAAGLDARKAEITERLASLENDPEGEVFLRSLLGTIDAVQAFVGRYESLAREKGDTQMAETLSAIATKGAENFRQALQLLRLLHFVLWESGTYHNTLGRFDQYLYPYFRNDLDKGVLTREEAYELVIEFFIACNKDSDLYPGMQQGDNGQSIVLGGRDADGRTQFNDLSEMCLEASWELNLIDPKINLRVDSRTPLRIFELGSKLTKRGLGFPQYSNDDVVIPGLIEKGYDPEDAHRYVVAACWEFIIPREGMDIPNIDAISLADIVRRSVEDLPRYATYDEFYASVEKAIGEEFESIRQKHRNLYIAPAPFLSLLMGGTVERARDISLGGKYNNYGIHGTGIATAADSLAAIKKFCFEEGSVDKQALAAALAADFDGYESLYEKLRYGGPKMGHDDDYVDTIAADLLGSFSQALEGAVNERGGVYRAGTGTAMYYIGHSQSMPATPDGRRAGEVIPANYSPSLFIKQPGPVSVIKSFTKPDLTRTINGGPLTLEFDDSVFRNDENITKLAMLVRSFIVLGGHQLQLNTVNKEVLLDAKKRPELYRNLIVRVWGWSGYFVELDEVYQDHVINRIGFGM